MALFQIPQRQIKSAQAVLKKAKEVSEPKIKLKKGTLLNKLAQIEKQVESALGDYNCLLLDTDEKWIEYCRNAVKGRYVALDTETDGVDTIHCNIAGVCIYSPNQIEAYAPIGHISNITEQLLPHQVSKEAIKEGFDIMVEGGCKFIFHNAYFDLPILRRLTGYFVDVFWDTLPGSALLDENEPHGLKYLWDKYVMEGSAGVHKFAELFDGIPFTHIRPDIGMKYSAHDAKMTYDLYKFQEPYLTRGTEECAEYHLEGVSDVFHTEEMPLIPVLADMFWRGIHVDVSRAEELLEKYSKLKIEAEEAFNESLKPLKAQIIQRQTMSNDIEYPVNYNSPVQMKILIYDILKSGVIFKKEPTGTGKHVLETVLSHPKYKDTKLYNIVQSLMEVKKYDKVINSFIIKLRELAVKSDGIVRPSFNSNVTKTGRLSSSGDFNVQQIPSKMKDIRNMFTAGEGRVYIGIDYSREEVAVCSAVCGDEKLIGSFKDNVDIYSFVASIAYDVPYEDCLEHNPDGTTNHSGKERRSAAKAVVLGILYSKSVRAIGEDLHVTPEKAQEIYDSVMKAFPTMANWIHESQEKAKRQGYIDGYYGRRRRLPDLLLDDYEFRFTGDVDDRTKAYYTNLYKSKLNKVGIFEAEAIIDEARRKGIYIKDNTGKKAKSERQIVNSIIQGSSADICKIALILMHNDPILKKYDAKLEMSIHD